MDTEHASLIDRFGSALTTPQRKKLKGMGHPINPVVLVGQRGISENLLENVEAALLAHELIKIKVHDQALLEETAEQVHLATKAQLVQRIGKVLLFYRAHPERPVITF